MTNHEYPGDSLQHRYLTPAGSPPERFPGDDDNTGDTSEANDEEDFDEDDDVDEDEEEEDEDLDEE